MINDEVLAAIEDVRATFPDASVSVTEDGQGGAFVIIDPVDAGAPYQQRQTWLGFQITFQCPYPDIYPHFVRGDLQRSDGAALGEGISNSNWQGRPALQISRRSNHHDPEHDTAALKAMRVLDWLAAK
jgi:hypothetical protein